MKNAILLLLVILATAGTAFAHGVEYRVVPGDGARIVEIFTSDGRPFSYESYEITGPDDTAAFQIGRTDRLGRVVFAPDRAGAWSIRVWSEDGHGVAVELDIENIEDIAAPGVGTLSAGVNERSRVTGVIVGIALILVIGGVIHVVKQKGQS